MELLRYVCLGILLIIRNLIKRILSFYRKFYSDSDYDKTMKNQVVLCTAYYLLEFPFSYSYSPFLYYQK